MSKKQRGETIFGLTLIAAGAVVFAVQQDLWPGGEEALRRLWPVTILCWGLSDLVAGRIAKGLWGLSLGSAFLLHTQDLVSLGETWPLLVIVAGAGMVYGSLASPKRSPHAAATAPMETP
ncbi:MAG: hypothetical protein AAF725_10390 [Acidobacteriota bacterium]